MRQPVTERTVCGPWACRPRHCCLSHQVIPLNYLQNEAIFMLDVCGCRYSPWPAVNGFIKCLFSVQFPGYKRTHTHTHTHTLVFMVYRDSIGVMVFIQYKLYVLLPYTYPTPKLSPHRRLCTFTFSLCMIYKRFELWGHWKCPHKSPSLCNTYVIPMSLYTFVSS